MLIFNILINILINTTNHVDLTMNGATTSNRADRGRDADIQRLQIIIQNSVIVQL